MQFRKGDKVRNSPGGVMEVVACSAMLALCSWTQDGEPQRALFELGSLTSAASRQQVQQQQQPQTSPAPSGQADGADPPDGTPAAG